MLCASISGAVAATKVCCLEGLRLWQPFEAQGWGLKSNFGTAKALDIEHSIVDWS